VSFAVSDERMKDHIHYNSDLASRRWFGYFDLLGVKQLYKTRNQISIFVAFSSAIEKFKERATAWPNIGYAWFSDTFILYTEDDSAVSFGAIDNISRWFFYFLINADIPVRGAISCDVLYADKENNLFFGEAFIEAYQYGEIQDWIGLLLCPSAEQRLEEIGLPAERRLNYAYAEVPFNNRPERQPNDLKAKLPVCIIGNWISINNNNPVIERLTRMRERVADQRIRTKYDRTIEFILKNRRVLASEINR
jgi:hypothetical protein